MLMATTSVLGTVYETLLCSPGMNEAVKIDVKISRKTVLLLNNVIEGSMNKDGQHANDLLNLVPNDDIEQLKNFAEECLHKAGLKELSDKMRQLISK